MSTAFQNGGAGGLFQGQRTKLQQSGEWREPFWRSKPSVYLLGTTGAVVTATLALPYTPLAEPLGVEGVSTALLAMLAAIVAGYIASAEAAKRLFYRPQRRQKP